MVIFCKKKIKTRRTVNTVIQKKKTKTFAQLFYFVLHFKHAPRYKMILVIFHSYLLCRCMDTRILTLFLNIIN